MAATVYNKQSKTITNTDLAVRPSKIVAGLEPTETNLLLQTIGKAIEKKVDSSEYVSQLQSGQIITDKNKKTKKPEKSEKSKKSSKTIVGSDEKVKTTPRKSEKVTKSNIDTPKSTDRTKPKRTSKEAKSKTDSEDAKPKTKEKVKKKEKTKDNGIAQPLENVEPLKDIPIPDFSNENVEQHTKEPLQIPATDSIGNNKSAPDDEQTPQTLATDAPADDVENELKRKRSTSASRPKSARPRSGDPKEKHHEENNKEPAPQPVQRRPDSSLRPPSVRPSSARPGAPRLRPDSGFPIKEVVPMGKINVIVESFDKDVDEEETVVIQSNPEVVEEQYENIDVPGDNKGHLVEQILEQINESDDKLQTVKTEHDWQKDGFQGKDAITKETNNLRSLIQTLTKTANPLGKLLNYLHEDIDAMHAELESWTNAKRQLFDEIAKQKKVSLEMNKPLGSQLEHLNQEIKKMEDEIISTRSNILRNELKIKELLSK